MHQLWPPGHYFVISEPMLRWKRRCLCNPLFQEMRLMKDAGLDTFFYHQGGHCLDIVPIQRFYRNNGWLCWKHTGWQRESFLIENPLVYFSCFGKALCVWSIILYILLWAVKVLVSACGLSILADGCFCGCGQYDPTASNCVGEWERWRTGVRFNDEEPN